MHFHNLLFINLTEILFIVFVAFLLFGTEKLPEIVRNLGKGYRDFQKAADQIKEEINKVTDDIKNETNKVTNGIKDEVNQVVDSVEEDLKDKTKTDLKG